MHPDSNPPLLQRRTHEKTPWQAWPWGLFLFLLLLLSAPIPADQPVTGSANLPVIVPAAIASAHPLATDAGLQILRNGGNAFDAAVTVSAVLGVVEPYGSGFGGGGFWLLHRQKDGHQVMIDGRERAPLKAHRDMYLDQAGQPVPRASIDGPLAAGIPGMPAALVHLAEQYGRLPLAVTLQPAIELSRDGFEVDEVYRRMAGWRLEALQNSLAASEIFLQDDQLPEAGFRVKQPDLANTLERLAAEGHAGFYSGELAGQLVNGVNQAGGIWQLDDLAQYQVVEREPIRFAYRDTTVVSAALPSSGGIVLAQALQILAGFNLDNLTQVQRTHLVIEAMRRAYRDRARYLGDSDQVQVPVTRLVSPEYAATLAADIELQQATPSDTTESARAEGTDTTHFSIVDSKGNRVAATLSINYPFGSGFVAPGTGVLLNDEMDDFSISPGVPNVYGLVGNEANAIAPGKRMLSSMSPTFVESPAGIAILGTPGGSRIISMVLLAILDMQQNNDPHGWVELPRFHHQFLPDEVQFEPDALSAEVQQQLTAMGHKLKPLSDRYGNMQAIFINSRSGEVQAASDSRGIGRAAQNE